MKNKKKVKSSQKPPEDFGKVCLCTHKHARHLLANLEDRIAIFQLELFDNLETSEETQEKYATAQSEIEKLAREKQNILSVLKRQPFVPTEQNDCIRLGCGPELIIDKNEPVTYFYDNTIIGNSKLMITKNTPLGEAIWLQKVGCKGSYVVGKKTHTFEIVSILPYSQAKKVFPSTRKVEDDTPEPGPAQGENVPVAEEATA